MSIDVELSQQCLLKTLPSFHLTALCLYQKAELVYAGQTLHSMSCPTGLCVCLFLAPCWLDCCYSVVSLDIRQTRLPLCLSVGCLSSWRPVSFHTHDRIHLPVKKMFPQRKHLAHRSEGRSSGPLDYVNTIPVHRKLRHGFPRASWPKK